MNFIKGLLRDLHPSYQPEGTYRDARNIILKDNRGAVSNEAGIVPSSALPGGYTPIGSCPLPDGRILVFSASASGRSEIGVINNQGVYEYLVNDSRLNFSLNHPIQATVKIIHTTKG